MPDTFNIQGVPHSYFYLNGTKIGDVLGNDDRKFSTLLGQLHEEFGAVVHKHPQMKYKEFRPYSEIPVLSTD